MGTVVKRAFKYRFYPTPDQVEQLNRTFGCVRLVYNRALAERTRRWTVDRQGTTYPETSAWQAAFVAFFDKRAGYPRFKSKRRSKASAEYTRSGFRWRDGQLTLAKVSESLNIVWSRPLPGGAQPSTVTVSRDAAGRWFVTLRVEDPTVRVLPPVDRSVGLDVGTTSLITLSTGDKIVNPKYERRDRRTLTRAQRALARKASGSNNQAKARLKVARIHARIADRRRDHLHKVTTRLVIREWTCTCGAVHDRDINAAKNILAAGLAER